MATHSSVLAWRIPGMREPDELPSMGIAQSRTRLKRLSSSSSSILIRNHNKRGTPQLWGNVREKNARVSFEEK